VSQAGRLHVEPDGIRDRGPEAGEQGIADRAGGAGQSRADLAREVLPDAGELILQAETFGGGDALEISQRVADGSEPLEERVSREIEVAGGAGAEGASEVRAREPDRPASAPDRRCAR
jgi:hypothetical protein